MMQTSIDKFFKTRKRAAVDEAFGFKSKISAKRIFDVLEDSSSAESSPSSRLNIKETNNEETVEDLPEQIKIESDTYEDVQLLNKSNNEEDGLKTPERSPTSQRKIRQELGLSEFSKVVRNSKRIRSLRKALDKVNKGYDRLKKIEEKLEALDDPKLQRFDVIPIEVPSSPVKAPTTPIKRRRLIYPSPTKAKTEYVSPSKFLAEGPCSSPSKIPSYERYQHLIAKGQDLLILPHKYSMLKEIFSSVDTIVKILTDRKEMVTFKKLKPDVQKMTSRNFVESHLGQIKAVFPNSFDITQEKIKSRIINEPDHYELVIRQFQPPGVSKLSGKHSGSSSYLLERQRIFHNALLEKTKAYHQEFLKTLDPPIFVLKDELRRWHPDFELNNVPDIEPIELPNPPELERITSVRGLLEKAHDVISCNKRMERALQASGESGNEEQESKCTNNPPTAANKALEKALKGIPKSLLAKIRAKQAAKVAETMKQTPEEAKEAMILSRLPELARIMRNVFITEKKGVLPVDQVVLKMKHSYRETLSTVELVEHLKLISKHVPGWMNFYNMRNMEYIRLSKDADLSRIIGKLQKLSS